MNKPEYNSITVSLGNGDSIQEADFPHIDGTILGMSTHIVGGTRHGKRVRLALKDGGNEVQKPVDAAFSETSGRSSFENGLMRLNIQNPGRITASVQLDSALGAGETIKVEVLLVSDKSQNASDDYNNC